MQHDLRTAEGVKAYMEESTSELDWNKRMDTVLAVHNGQYPPFWYMSIIATGLLARTSQTWGGTDKINILRT